MEQVAFISHSSLDKPVADAICHHLEGARIRCWIAPRDISTADRVSSIMEGLHRSEVFVIVISRNSISSLEVLNEVTEAKTYLPLFEAIGNVYSQNYLQHL